VEKAEVFCREKQKRLLTTKVHPSEAALFFDGICAIIQGQRFAQPLDAAQKQNWKQGVLESWKERP
jgi:hypothetical protein